MTDRVEGPMLQAYEAFQAEHGEHEHVRFSVFDAGFQAGRRYALSNAPSGDALAWTEALVAWATNVLGIVAERRVPSADVVADGEAILAGLKAALALSTPSGQGGDVQALRAALVAAKIPHLRVDGDPFFSCPVAQREDSDEPDDYPNARCNCGADAHNAAIDAALSATDRPAETGERSTAGHRFVPMSGSQDTGGVYQRCSVFGCTSAPNQHP